METYQENEVNKYFRCHCGPFRKYGWRFNSNLHYIKIYLTKINI